jgi:hypothetical protein
VCCAELQALVPAVCASAALVAATHFLQSRALEQTGRALISPLGLLSAYQLLYARAIADGDGHVAHLWAIEEVGRARCMSRREMSGICDV